MSLCERIFGAPVQDLWPARRRYLARDGGPGQSQQQLFNPDETRRPRQ